VKLRRRTLFLGSALACFCFCWTILLYYNSNQHRGGGGGKRGKFSYKEASNYYYYHHEDQTNRDLSATTSLSDEDFEYCITTLEMVASSNNNKVDMAGFIQFLNIVSGGSTSYKDFEELPTSFVLIYYTAACSFGDGCDSEEEATISLQQIINVDNAEGVLHMFCRSVKDLNTVQSSINFQFQIRYVGGGEENNIGMEQILAGAQGGEIKQSLAEVTRDVLLDGFGCSTDQIQRNLLSRGRNNDDNNVSNLQKGERNYNKSNALQHQDRRKVQDDEDSQPSCDYNIRVEIKNIVPSGK
jgi:hypothetical protein